MFKIHMLPADHGDCLLIEYGDAQKPRRILIDGGTQHSYPLLKKKIESLPDERAEFELFVITHIDADHIGGSLELLREIEELEKEVVFRDVWFNGWHHITGVLGPKQGELVTDHLLRRELPWNKDFAGIAVVVPDNGDLPVVDLPDGLRLTLLSPNWEKLGKLKTVWEKAIAKAELELGNVKDKDKYFTASSGLLGNDVPDVEKLSATPFTTDKTAPNGSSIAFLAEYDDGQKTTRCLFTGDAHPGILQKSLARLIADDRNPGIENGKLNLDAFKVSHHGSKNNLSRELIESVVCPKFLFSTNGQQFKHPDRESVARVINFARSKTDEIELVFNYKTDLNKIWEDIGLQEKYNYRTTYPQGADEGTVIEL
jgi:hypothetical protein